MAKTNAELLKEIEMLKSKILESESDNESLKEEVESLHLELDKLDGMIEPIEGVVVDTLTRNDIIQGLLSQVPLNVHNAEAYVDNLLSCADILLKKING